MPINVLAKIEAQVYVCACDKVPPSERFTLIVQTEWLCVIMVSINLGWVGGPVRLSIHPCLSLSLSFHLPVALTHTYAHKHTHHISRVTLIVTQAAWEVGYFSVWQWAKGSKLYQETGRVPKTFSITKPLDVPMCYLNSRHEKCGSSLTESL